MYICGENQKKWKEYYDTQDSGYFWKEGMTMIKKGYMRAPGVLVKFS